MGIGARARIAEDGAGTRHGPSQPVESGSHERRSGVIRSTNLTQTETQRLAERARNGERKRRNAIAEYALLLVMAILGSSVNYLNTRSDEQDQARAFAAKYVRQGTPKPPYIISTPMRRETILIGETSVERQWYFNDDATMRYVDTVPDDEAKKVGFSKNDVVFAHDRKRKVWQRTEVATGDFGRPAAYVSFQFNYTTDVDYTVMVVSATSGVVMDASQGHVPERSARQPDHLRAQRPKPTAELPGPAERAAGRIPGRRRCAGPGQDRNGRSRSLARRTPAMTGSIRALHRAMASAHAEMLRCEDEKRRLLPTRLVTLKVDPEWVDCITRARASEIAFVAAAREYCASLADRRPDIPSDLVPEPENPE